MFVHSNKSFIKNFWRIFSYKSSSLLSAYQHVDDGSTVTRYRLSYRVLTFTLLLMSPAILAEAIYFDIPQQRADKALIQFAQQANLTLMFPANIARQYQSTEVKGDMLTSRAVKMLLQGTNLQPTYLAAGRLKIEPIKHQAHEEVQVKQPSKISALAAFISSLFIAPNVVANVNEDGLEEIVVTGQKLSRLKALDIKRNSNTIMDALSIDNLGRLPDKNAAESLNRLPGVSIKIEKGEGRYASIRGIRPDWNRVTINGFETGSPEREDSGRSMPLDVLGGEMLQSIEVFKAKTADMDGEGIGGTVNIVTKSPTEQLNVTANVRYGIEGDSQDSPFGDSENPYNFDISASGRLSDKVGWTLGGSYTDRQYLARGVYQDDWIQVGSAAFPQAIKNNHYVITRDRTTAIAGLDFQTTENSNLMLQAFYSTFNEDQQRHRFRVNLDSDENAFVVNPDNSLTFNPGASTVRFDRRLKQEDKDLFNISLIGQTDLDKWVLEYGVNYGKNEILYENTYWQFRQSDEAGDLGPDTIRFRSDGLAVVTEGGHHHNRIENLRFHSVSIKRGQTVKQNIISAKFDASYLYQLGSWDAEAKFGVKYVTGEKDYNGENDSYRPESINVAPFDLFVGPFNNEVDGFRIPNLWFDLDKGMSLLGDTHLFTFDSQPAADTLSDRVIEETITALYAMNTLEFENWQLITGLRFEHTDIESTGFTNNEVTGTFEPVSFSGSNQVVLPSILVNYYATDNTIIRASYTTSLGRPDYPQLSPSSTFSEDSADGPSLSIGNPNLNPYYADNYDVSLEWYPSDASVISLAWFKKKIDDFIVRDLEIVNGGIVNGLDYGVDRLRVSTYRNADTADVEGYEFNIQHQFESLPDPFNGIGASYSYTSIDATFFDSNIGQERKLEGQPEEIQSFTLFYENFGFYAGLTYNFNGAFLQELGNVNDVSDDLEEGDFGRWDFRASYQLNEALSIYLDANNLNNEPTTEFQGGNKFYNTEFEYIGTTYYLGATYRF